MKKALVLWGIALPISMLFSFKSSDVGGNIFSTTQLSKTMTIEKEIIVNSGIEQAWKVLGTEFADAYKWASAVNHSEGKGAGFNGATCSERGCDIAGMGKTEEKLLQFSNENHALSYQVEGMPSMIRHATNSWQLTTLGQGQTKLQMRMEIQVGGLMGAMMKPMLKMKMSKMGSELVEEFKYYLENGHPHPRKVKAEKKFKS